jgi:hypothetical protein
MNDKARGYLDPGYNLERIDHIWAFVSFDDGGEGVCAAPMGGLGMVPLIAADPARVESLKPIAAHIAKSFGKPVRLVKFTSREEIEVYQP